MKTYFVSPRLGRTLRRTWLIFLFLILFHAVIPCAGAQTTAARAQTIRSAPVPLLADSWGVGKVWHFVEHSVGDRRRMFQFATIGMCIGLYIMMRRLAIFRE